MVDRWIKCDLCNGEGVIEEANPFPDDPYFCTIIQCPACSCSGQILFKRQWLRDAERLPALSQIDAPSVPSAEGK